MAQVITYSTTRESISITPDQERMLRKAGVWPKDGKGQEMVDVSYGLHAGEPTFTDDELRDRCEIA